MPLILDVPIEWAKCISESRTDDSWWVYWLNLNVSTNRTRLRLILTCMKSRMFQGKLSDVLVKRGAINVRSWNEQTEFKLIRILFSCMKCDFVKSCGASFQTLEVLVIGRLINCLILVAQQVRMEKNWIDSLAVCKLKIESIWLCVYPNRNGL